MEKETTRKYALLPDELLAKILDNVPKSVVKMNGMFNIQEEPIRLGIEELRKKSLTTKVSTTDYTHSLIAVDGGMVLERMTGSDLILSVAVGVEGLTEDTAKGWGENRNQYYQWQTVLPHGEANARLAQGVMFLMELSVLASSQHEIRIMDGTHFTPILKINSMLSAKEEHAGLEYITGLKEFLCETYEKVIPDIPDIIKAALNDNAIIALAKYSSSQDIVKAYLSGFNINLDDKTFFSLGLDEDEYLIPLSVGQSEEEKDKVWNDLHIKCNLDIPEQEALNKALEEAIYPLITKNKKRSELFFTYYKPYKDGPAYRIELKRNLAQDKVKLEKCLLSIKRQIIFPEIREPFPQYLVDLMAKNVAEGMYAMQEAIRLSPDLKIDKGRFNLLFNYRT